MKKQLILIGTILAVLLLSNIAVAQRNVVVKGSKNNITGNGNLIKQTRNVEMFTSLKIESVFNVFIKQGKQQSLVVETDDNLMELVSTRVIGSNLKLSLSGGVNNITKLNAYITVEDLNQIDVSGVTNITFETPFIAKDELNFKISGVANMHNAEIKAQTLDFKISGVSKIKANIKCERLRLEVSGVSNIDLKGVANEQKVRVSGTSNVNLDELNCKESTINASGMANVKVKKSDKLYINKSGNASVKSY